VVRFPRERSWSSEGEGGGGVHVDCMRDIFVLHDLLAQGKIDIWVGYLLG
jgi:hypothetical protein